MLAPNPSRPPPPEMLPYPLSLEGFHLPSPPQPPMPLHWTPIFDADTWIYTDGSLIEGESRLGAAVIHNPSATALHIDASGLAETHTIMRAELVAIYVALDRLKHLEDFRLFTDSLSSLQALRKRLYHLDLGSYHHHQVLIDNIVNLILEREDAGVSTTLKKVRAHTNVMGNELADAAAKRAVRQFDVLAPRGHENFCLVGRCRPAPTLLGHVYTLPPNAPGGIGGGHTHNVPKSPVVDHTGGGTSSHESLHTTI